MFKEPIKLPSCNASMSIRRCITYLRPREYTTQVRTLVEILRTFELVYKEEPVDMKKVLKQTIYNLLALQNDLIEHGQPTGASYITMIVEDIQSMLYNL